MSRLVSTELLVGSIAADAGLAENGSAMVNVSDEGRERFVRDLYLSIRDSEQGVEFLARVVQGPIHAEVDGQDGVTGGAYGVTGVLELLGQLMEGDRLMPTNTRPRPGSEVNLFEDERLRRLLKIEGDFYLGKLIGSTGARVELTAASKNFLPRNVGVFGTVGSGKSNTMQVLMEEALRAGWSVVAIDVEGEYVSMDGGTDDPAMVELLERDHGLSPRGIENFRVYVPQSGRTGATDPIRFKVPLSALQPEVVADILEFTEGQVRMFEAVTRQAASRNEYLKRQGNGPGGSVGVAPAAAATSRPYTLQDLIDGLQESGSSVPLLPRIRPEDLVTAASLRAKLVHLGRSDVVDWNQTAQVAELPVDDLVAPGRLSIVDVSEADDHSRNIAIAYALQALFERVVQTPVGQPMPNGVVRPPLMVVIEEVHTFVSRATAHRMRAVLDSLQVISRRGRKRWMALALVSQQPNHVPDELFELANTRFIHLTKSVSNIEAVKDTTGGVHEALWPAVSMLGPGQCLLSGPAVSNALLVNVRPALSRRMFSV